MRRRIVAAAGLLGLLAAPAYAQEGLVDACAQMSPTYTPASAGPALVTLGYADDVERQFRFLCGQVASVMTTLQPSVGISFSGGNPVLGTATTLGRRFGFLPRVSVTARANVALAKAPDFFEYASEIDGSSQTLPPAATRNIPLSSLQGDLSIGLFNGFGFTPALDGVGAVDLLGSVSFIPKAEAAGINEAILNWGGGARVGLLKQGLLVPGVSVSAMYRRMGEVEFGDPTFADAPGYFATDLSTLSLRGIVSKGILLFDFAAGAGYDMYAGNVSYGWQLQCSTAECNAANPGGVTATGLISDEELKTAAWNVFGNVGLSFLVLNIVAEVGYQKSMDLLTEADLQQINPGSTQTFTEDELQGGKLFGSFGLRIAI